MITLSTSPQRLKCLVIASFVAAKWTLETKNVLESVSSDRTWRVNTWYIIWIGHRGNLTTSSLKLHVRVLRQSAINIHFIVIRQDLCICIRGSCFPVNCFPRWLEMRWFPCIDSCMDLFWFSAWIIGSRINIICHLVFALTHGFHWCLNSVSGKKILDPGSSHPSHLNRGCVLHTSINCRNQQLTTLLDYSKERQWL